MGRSRNKAAGRPARGTAEASSSAPPGAKERRRERNAEETRERILTAAEDEFARKGYDGARLRDVALAAGVHHALLHHYYGDKEGLFRAVVERAFGAVSSRAFRLLHNTADLRELTEVYVDTLVDFYAEHPNLVHILHFASLDEGSPAYAACEDIAENMVLPLFEATAQLVADAQERGVIRDDIDERRLVALCLGAASYLFHEDNFFSMFLGEDVRSTEALEAHKRATKKLIVDSIFVSRVIT